MLRFRKKVPSTAPPPHEPTRAFAMSSHSADAACPGARVRIFGLKSRADLNGACGKLLRFLDQAERWAVQCEGTGECIKVKSSNLWVYDAELVRHASRRTRTSVKALNALLDRVPHDDIETLHECDWLGDTELLAVQAWVLDIRSEGQQLEEIAGWMAKGGVHDALTANFGADVACMIRRRAASVGPRTGPLVLVDEMGTWFKYGFECDVNHEEFFSTNELLQSSDLEREVIEGLLQAEGSVADAVESWEQWQHACQLGPPAMKLAWQVLYAERPLTEFNACIAPVILDAVRPECDITPSRWQAHPPSGGMGLLPDRRVELACEACRHELLPWQVRALERVLGVAEENDAIRAAARACAKHQVRAREQSRRATVELPRMVYDGMRCYKCDCHAAGACFGLTQELLDGMGEGITAINAEPYVEGRYHAATGRCLRLLDRAVEQLEHFSAAAHGAHHRELARKTVAAARPKLEHAWL
eukprot:2441657-Prymnesium_polylepis.1